MTVLEAAARARRGGRDRGADAARLPPRHVLAGLPGGRGVAGVRAHAARAPRAALGPPARTASRIRCPDGSAALLVPRPRPRPRPRSTRSAAGRRRALARVRRARTCADSTRCARTMLAGLPAARAARRELLAGLGPRATLDFARAAAHAGGGARARELFAAGGARAWLYGSAMHGDVAARRRGQRDRRRVPATCSGTRSAGRARRAAPAALAEALVGLPRRARRRACGPARRSTRIARRARPRGRRRARRRRARAGALVDRRRHAARRSLALAGDALPDRYAAALRRYRYGPPTLKVDWALDGPIPWSAPEAREAGTVHVGGDEGRCCGALASGPAARAAVPPARPAVGRRPSRAPAGKHTAWAYTHGRRASTGPRERPPRRADRGARSSASPPASATASSPATCSAPADLERRNANLVGRRRRRRLATRSTSSSSAPSARSRPTGRRSAGSTSAAPPTFPGGAVHGVPGHAAARLALALDLPIRVVDDPPRRSSPPC